MPADYQKLKPIVSYVVVAGITLAVGQETMFGEITSYGYADNPGLTALITTSSSATVVAANTARGKRHK